MSWSFAIARLLRFACASTRYVLARLASGIPRWHAAFDQIAHFRLDLAVPLVKHALRFEVHSPDSCAIAASILSRHTSRSPVYGKYPTILRTVSPGILRTSQSSRFASRAGSGGRVCDSMRLNVNPLRDFFRPVRQFHICLWLMFNALAASAIERNGNSSPVPIDVATTG